MKPAYAAADVVLNPAGIKRWKTGHPWVYRSGIEVVEEETGREAIARVLTPTRRDLGWALLSRESQITLRRLDTSDPVTPAYFAERIRRAAAVRRERYPDRDAYRVVFGEADAVPGLVVDRYGDHLVAQFLTWGMDALREDIVPMLEETWSPVSILGRNDTPVRRHEGLPLIVTELSGSVPETAVYHEGALEFTVDPRRGQKTGSFLDQVDNHLLAGALARGRVLDLFTFAGGFALAAAKNSERVTAVDTSTEALALARAHAAANGIETVAFEEANAFDYLRDRDRAGDRFDTVILDPPAFAKSKTDVAGALRGYKEINLRAMKILDPGGILVTCSCSYHVSAALLMEVLERAAADARRSFRVVERRGAGHDHPVRLGFPESEYLKCVVLEVLA